jgi:hypothetical protein
MEKFVFGIVIFHVILGFTWIIYKLQFEKNNSNKNKD